MAYEISNPLGIDNLDGIFTAFSSRIIQIVIPIAVLLYVWAGVQMLIAAGRPEYINSAKKTFLYTSLGLLVIFIGSGFVSLVKSVLNAGGSPASTPTTVIVPPTPTPYSD